ncbi:MAG TPA: Ig-like domain-containing domain [Hanamia sp.]|nr:Ig-like domain-containing domain [Hanamia sp.]
MMKMRNAIFFLMLGGLVYFLSVTGSGCAQIGSPMGGPRDSLPPVLLNSNPPNRTLHFSGNKIVLTFDEYVQLADVQKNLLVAPTPKINPYVDYKLKTVTIKLRDTLQPNTTYNIQLGNSIQDINENNPYRDYSYVFSTGSYIDSLKFHGTVKLAETGKTDSTITVFLYKNLDDSAVYKEKPRYIARVDSSGKFAFNHLASGVYNVFALKDESGQKMYNNPTQTFAFSDSTITVSEKEASVNLFAYAEEKGLSKPSTSSAVTKNAAKKLQYTSSIASGTQDLLKPLILEFSIKLKNFDSSKIKLTDTLLHPFANTSISLDSTGKKVTVDGKWDEDTHYRLLVEKDFAVDTAGTELLKSDTLKFKTKRDKEYGSIKINFKNLEKFRHPVLQFVTNNEVIHSYPLTATSWSAKLFDPGDYDLRILDDDNQNGIWDPGNYHLRKQPEKVYSISKKLNIRADWDNEVDIVL